MAKRDPIGDFSGGRFGPSVNMTKLIGIIVEFVAYFPILVVLAAGKKDPVLLDHLSTYLRTHRRRIGIVVSLGLPFTSATMP